MADMREPGALWFHFFNQRERLFDIGMRGVRDVAQGVEDEIIKPTKQGLRTFGNLAEIGEVRHLAHAETEDGLHSVDCRDRYDLRTEEVERPVNRVQVNERKSGSGLPVTKYVS